MPAGTQDRPPSVSSQQGSTCHQWFFSGVQLLSLSTEYGSDRFRTAGRKILFPRTSVLTHPLESSGTWRRAGPRSQSPAPLMHWLCGLGLGLAASPREIGSQRFPPYRAVGRIRRMCSWHRRAQQVSFRIAHGRLCYWYLCLSLGLILSFQNSVLNTGCPRIVEERFWRNESQTHPQSFG